METRRLPHVKRPPRKLAGVTLVELMVALAIGSFLIIGAVQIASQSRHAFRVNESIARVQETAQFALDTLETDLRMASHWGLLSRGHDIEGRSLPGNPDPLGLLPTAGSIAECGAAWVLDLERPVEGSNNGYGLACAAGGVGGPQANSDTLTVRRAAREPATALTDGRLYVQSSRTQGLLFADATVPSGLGPDSQSHALIVNSYYVAADSELIPGVPALRRKTLTVNSGSPTVEDQEVAPGVENLQVQFGVDVDQDSTVDRYVNPGDSILTSPNTRVLTARVWLLVRSVDRETGIDDTRTYTPGDVNLGQPADEFRRLQVSKTILLRNVRS